MRQNYVYIVTLSTYYECGDCNNDDSVIIGVYSVVDDAEKAGKDYLLENFAYDAESGVFYDKGCDEAWISIWECEINQKVDLNKPPVKHIPEIPV